MADALLEQSDHCYEMDKESSEINKIHHHKTWRYNLAANGSKIICFHCFLRKTYSELSPAQEPWAGRS